MCWLSWAKPPLPRGSKPTPARFPTLCGRPWTRSSSKHNTSAAVGLCSVEFSCSLLTPHRFRACGLWLVACGLLFCCCCCCAGRLSLLLGWRPSSHCPTRTPPRFAARQSLSMTCWRAQSPATGRLKGLQTRRCSPPSLHLSLPACRCQVRGLLTAPCVLNTPSPLHCWHSPPFRTKPGQHVFRRCGRHHRVSTQQHPTRLGVVHVAISTRGAGRQSTHGSVCVGAVPVVRRGVCRVFAHAGTHQKQPGGRAAHVPRGSRSLHRSVCRRNRRLHAQVRLSAGRCVHCVTLTRVCMLGATFPACCCCTTRRRGRL